jgi:hypothetical protein
MMRLITILLFFSNAIFQAGSTKKSFEMAVEIQNNADFDSAVQCAADIITTIAEAIRKLIQMAGRVFL